VSNDCGAIASLGAVDLITCAHSGAVSLNVSR